MIGSSVVSSNVSGLIACFAIMGIKPRISGSSRSLAPARSNRTTRADKASAFATLV
jgi:hypothetical protein